MSARPLRHVHAVHAVRAVHGRWIGTALILGAGLALTGCGGSNGSAPAASTTTATTSSSSSSSAAPTSTSAVGTTVPGADLARRVQTAIAAAGSARFVIHETGTTGGGVIDVKHPGLRASIALKSGGENIKAVVLPGVLYINSGQVVQRKHWIKLAGTLHAKTLRAAQADILSGVGIVSPAIQAIAWRSATFRTGATTTVGGVTATEYDATVPKAAFIAAFPVQARPSLKLTADVKVRAWLDAKNRPVKLEVTSTFTDGEESDTTTFSDWGSAPAIKVPARSDTLTGRF